jgi:negative regulator of genetic competence, sporulation and motility
MPPEMQLQRLKTITEVGTLTRQECSERNEFQRRQELASAEHAAKKRKIDDEQKLQKAEHDAKMRKVEEDAEHESQKAQMKRFIEFGQIAKDAGFLSRGVQLKTRQDELWEEILGCDTSTTLKITTDP